MKFEIIKKSILLSTLIILLVIYYGMDNPKVERTYELKKDNTIAVMVYDETAEDYVSWESIPSGMYEINKEKTYCVNGGRVTSYDNGVGKLNYTINTDDKCYVYFDVLKICEDGMNLGDCLVENSSKFTSLKNEVYSGDFLYRFIGGVYDDVDNYICLGSDSCETNSEAMYRIIGVNPNNGHIKVISEKVWNTHIWDDNLNGAWKNSLLFSTVNYQWLNSINFGHMLTNEVWYAGQVKESDMTNRTTVLTAASKEKINANVGIASVMDYYLTYDGDNNFLDDTSIFEDDLEMNWTWMSAFLLDRNNNHKGYEYLLNKQDYLTVWENGGLLNSFTLTLESGYRPSFYLASDVKYISGTGNKEDPFIVSKNKFIPNNCNGTLANCLLNNDVPGLQKEYIGEDTLYRFSGTSGNLGINNYICLGSNSCEVDSENMYRIIGVEPSTGYLKIIKQTKYISTVYEEDAIIPGSTTLWTDSSAYAHVVNWYDDVSFKDKIVSHSWSNNAFYDVVSKEDVLAEEKKDLFTDFVGALSLGDVYAAYNDTVNKHDLYNHWITLNNNGTQRETELTMTQWGDYDTDGPWSIYSTSNYFGVLDDVFDGEGYIRPTFYLGNDINYVSGNGSVNDPFIVS